MRKCAADASGCQFLGREWWLPGQAMIDNEGLCEAELNIGQDH